MAHFAVDFGGAPGSSTALSHFVPHHMHHLQSGTGDQNGQINRGYSLNTLLNGISLIEIVDSGLGLFHDKTIRFRPTDFGVICILNIPYNVTKSEIEHFLGRNASLIAQSEDSCSIHIIMERPTSKTMDCYVELESHEAAVEAYKKHENSVMMGKHPRIGTRHVEVVISSQDELLKAIFPRARGLIWERGVPHKIDNDDPYSSGFQGFFTREELIGMYRHAESPQRSPFSVKCLQRTFECMISTLYKFPWHAQHMYTLEDRSQLFGCYMQQLNVLVAKVAEAQTVGLDTKLLIDFLTAGVNCVGFGERMRYQICSSSGGVSMNFPITHQAAHWPFDVLSVPKMAPDGGRWWFEHANVLDLLMYIIQLGYSISGNNYPHSTWIKVLPRSLASDYGDDPINGVRFCFRDEVYGASYNDVVSHETDLMRELLKLGYEAWCSQLRDAWNRGQFDEDMQRDIECLADLQELCKTYGNIGRLASAESPKGTVSPSADEGYALTDINGEPAFGTPGNGNGNGGGRDGESNINVDAHKASSTPSTVQGENNNPSVEAFEPSFTRRNSEPAISTPRNNFATPVPFHGSQSLKKSTAVLNRSTVVPITPTPRTRPSAAVEIRHPDGQQILFSPPPSATRTAHPDPTTQSPLGSIGDHLARLSGTNINRSPLRPIRHVRGAFSLSQTTIHEEDEDEEGEEEDEEIMMTGRPRRSTDAGYQH